MTNPYEQKARDITDDEKTPGQIAREAWMAAHVWEDHWNKTANAIIELCAEKCDVILARREVDGGDQYMLVERIAAEIRSLKIED